MYLGHLNRKNRKRFIRDYYGFIPENWDTIKELPKKEDMKINKPVTFGVGSVYVNTGSTTQSNLYLIDDITVEAKCVPQPVPCCAPSKLPWKKGIATPINKEEEDSMTTNNERTYLNNRSNDVFYAHRDTIADKFRINNSDQPKTYKELIDAIKNDKYTIDEKMAKRVDVAAEDGGYIPWGNTCGIKFNLPTAPDWDGHSKAAAELEKARTVAKDIINTQDAAAGLKALQDFEAWTFEGKAS